MSDIESDERICTRCRAVMTYEPDDEATTVCHSCAYVALDEMGRELAEAQSRIADLERDLAASITAQKNLAAELRTAQAEVENLRADCAQTADGERAADDSGGTDARPDQRQPLDRYVRRARPVDGTPVR